MSQGEINLKYSFYLPCSIVLHENDSLINSDKSSRNHLLQQNIMVLSHALLLIWHKYLEPDVSVR